MSNTVYLWVGFNIFLLAMLAIDLFLFHKKSHQVSLREALTMSAGWVGLALAFNVVVYYAFGREKALEFLTGYLMEKSLSVDNIFVFLLIFRYFKVSGADQHDVLFWGVLGALAMRAIFIVLGVSLIREFHWLTYIFGAFLILTGIKLGLEKDKEIHPERNPAIRLFRRFVPVTDTYDGPRFLVKRHGRYFATPLLVVLIVVETTDVVFAMDSIPAIMAISLDPFIVYTSNAFAILGLRALYFALAGIMGFFHYLHYGLAAILVFVGAKMMLADVFKMPIAVALAVVALILGVSIVASLLTRRENQPSVQ
jgi:tellurite resistance protein TerC